jgi:hypothetical protein
MSAHVLDPAVYWKLRAISAENMRLGVAVQYARDAAAAAQKKQDVLLAELGAQYHFTLDPQSVPSVTLDDDTCTLTIPEKESPRAQ